MKILENIRNKIDFRILEILYLAGLFIYSVKIITRFSLILDLPDEIGDLMYTLSFYLMLPKIILNKYEKKDLFLCGSILILGYFIYHFKHTTLLWVLPLTLAGLKGSDIRKIVRFIFIITTAFVIIHTAGYFVEHFINGGTWSDIPFFNRYWETRNTVLCKDTNDYGALSALMILEYVYLTDRKKRCLLKITVLFILSFCFYAIGTSRTALLISLIVTLYLLIDKISFIDKFMRPLTIAVFILVIIVSIYMMFADLDMRIPHYVNWVANGRGELTQEAIDRYGFSLFPQYEEMKADPYEIVLDNLCAYLIISDGILYSFGLFVLTLYLICCCKDKIIDYYIMTMCVWSLTERLLTFVTITVVPMLVVHYYYSLNRGNNEQCE